MFEKVSGLLSSVNFCENQFIKSGPQINVWRAPLNNETDYWHFRDASQWFQTGLDRLSHQLENIQLLEVTDKKVVIAVESYASTPTKQAGFLCNYVYSVKGDGEIVLNTSVIPQGKLPDWLPKIGIQMVIPQEFQNMVWYGRGPFETYPDRKTGAKIGIYETKISAHYVPYLVPQDYGNKSDVRWLTITNEEGIGFFINGVEQLNISAQEYSMDNLTRAMYPFQLIKQDGITINLDHRVTGVGGTPISPLLQYRVFPQRYKFQIRFFPFNSKKTSAKEIWKKKYLN
jgi:beta-galactosidase